MKLLRIGVFSVLVLFAGGASALATPISFTGSFGISWAVEYSANISSPSFSLSGGTADAGYVGFCSPGDTCTLSAALDFFESPYADIMWSMGGVGGVTNDGNLIFQTTFTAPVFDPNTWDCTNSDPATCWKQFDAGLTTFSGTATGWSCPAPADSPCANTYDSTGFSVDMSGTADATFLERQDGLITTATYEVLNGTATVTLSGDPSPDPTPEPSALLFVPSGLAVLLLLGWRKRQQKRVLRGIAFLPCNPGIMVF